LKYFSLLAFLLLACAPQPEPVAPSELTYRVGLALVEQNERGMSAMIATGQTAGEGCLGSATATQFAKFREIANRGELIGQPFTEAVYEIMEVRVQASDGSFVGFGGWRDGIDVTGLVFRLSEEDYAEARRLAEIIVGSPDCGDS